MAHADYSCCAVCDSKMNYGEDATKEALCVRCIETFLDRGLRITRPEHLAEHIASLDDADALRLLHEVGFSPCYYQNDFDAALIERGLIETGIDHGATKWGKRLAPLDTVKR